jgi:hypothetical protein
LASGVTVDYDEGELAFAWKHGGDSRVTYAYDWGAEDLPARRKKKAA